MKLGRNDPCWCGSGKKYKRCHFNRHLEKKINPWEASKTVRRAFSSQYCSAPDSLKNKCCGNIVRAHSVSKSTNLKRISRNGHVYAFIPSFENLSKNSGIVQPELVGINKASTFTGFCAYHDKKFFSPLEDNIFNGTKEQCFLLAYRALAREYFTKKSSASLMDYLKSVDRGRELPDQIAIQELAMGHSLGVSAGVRDLKIYKNKYDKMLENTDYYMFRTLIINFKKLPSVMCSAAIYPECDFQGNKLQDLLDLDVTPDLITFSSIASINGGSVVFSWNDENSKGYCEKFVSSLKSVITNDLTSSLIRFFFEFSENVFLEPNWWESLSNTKQEKLIFRLLSGASFLKERKNDCLCNDVTRFDDWDFIDIKEI